MDKIAKSCPRFLNAISYISITTAFVGMGFILYILIQGTVHLLYKPEAQPVLSPVLPGVSLPGLPTLSFWHWIIAILIIAVIHECSHGIWARLYNIKIKSSGWGFLGPILAAFVEPDEKQLTKQSRRKQLAVLAAGPFSNLITGIIFLLIGGFIIAPLAVSTLTYEGITIVDIAPNMPLAQTDFKVGDTITHLDDKSITTPQEFTSYLDTKKPGEEITIKNNEKEAKIVLKENQNDKEKAMMGVTIQPTTMEIKPEIEERWGKLPWGLVWLNKLFFWLYAISFGVGLFNVLPLGPVDGGRMFLLAAEKITKNHAKRIYVAVSFLCIMLIIINLFPFLIKLLSFLFTPLLLLF